MKAFIRKNRYPFRGRQRDYLNHLAEVNGLRITLHKKETTIRVAGHLKDYVVRREEFDEKRHCHLVLRGEAVHSIVNFIYNLCNSEGIEFKECSAY